MERLTEKYENNEIWVKNHDYISASRKLADYEDLEESGRLIKFPCKIGDTVWYIGTECDNYNCVEYSDYCYRGCKKPQIPKIRSTVIKQFRILGNRWDSMTDTDATASTYEKEFYLNTKSEKVFLTKEEAEQALERMKEKSD